MRLDQFFRHQDQCQDLRPFGDYVADYLSPFGLRVHRQVKGEPTRAGQDKKNSQRVVDDELQERRTVTTTPDQSAMALPKNEPLCVC